MNGPHEGLDDLTPLECMAGGFLTGARFAAHLGSDPEGILGVELPAYFQEIQREKDPAKVGLGEALLRVAAWARSASAPTSNRDPQTAEARPALAVEGGSGAPDDLSREEEASAEWAVKTLREADPEDPVVQTLRFYLNFYRHGYIAALKSRPGPRSTIHALEQVESEEHWTAALELIEQVSLEHVNFQNVCEHALMLAANRYRPHLTAHEGGEQPAAFLENGKGIAGRHRGIRYRIFRRPSSSKQLLGYFRLGSQRFDRGLGSLFIPDAIAHLHRLIDQELDSEGGEEKGVLLEELAADYLAAFERLVQAGDRDVKSLKIYQAKVRRFVSFCSLQGVQRVNQLNPGILAKYKEHLESQGLKPVTIRHEQNTTIRGLLRRAFRERILAEDLGQFLPPIDRVKKQEARVFTRPQLAAIIRAMRRQKNGRHRTKLLRFCLYTGCRISQARELNWTDIDLEKRTAQLIPQKGVGPNRIPLTRRMERLLRSIPRRDERVFGTVDRKSPGEWLHLARRKAGVAGPFRWHDLRSTAISRALNDPKSRMDVQSVMALVGHQSFETTKGYLKKDLDALREKMETVR